MSLTSLSTSFADLKSQALNNTVLSNSIPDSAPVNPQAQEVSVEEVSVGVDGTGTAVARDWSQTAPGTQLHKP